MNELEQQLTYPLGEAIPVAGHTLDVAPGVRWLRMGLPFQLDHINLWLLRERLDIGSGPVDGWTIVDCGIADAPTRAAWERLFEHGLQGLPVLRVIVTHMHPDHMGLAHWLTERWQVRLWISAGEHGTARLAHSGAMQIGGETNARFMATHGLTDPAALTGVRDHTDGYRRMVPEVPAHYRRLGRVNTTIVMHP